MPFHFSGFSLISSPGGNHDFQTVQISQFSTTGNYMLLLFQGGHIQV